MYACSNDVVARIERRPANWRMLECFGDHRFIAENRPWDADEWEILARATGLYALSPEAGLHESDRWRKAFVKERLRGRDVAEAVRVVGAHNRQL